MLPLEPLGELLDGDGTPIGITPGRWIIAVLGGRDDRDGAATRLLAGKYAAYSETDASRPSAGAVLYNVSLATAGQDTQPEARQVLVPDEVFSLSYLCGVDDALGEFRHVWRLMRTGPRMPAFHAHGTAQSPFDGLPIQHS